MTVIPCPHCGKPVIKAQTHTPNSLYVDAKLLPKTQPLPGTLAVWTQGDVVYARGLRLGQRLMPGEERHTLHDCGKQQESEGQE